MVASPRRRILPRLAASAGIQLGSLDLGHRFHGDEQEFDLRACVARMKSDFHSLSWSIAAPRTSFTVVAIGIIVQPHHAERAAACFGNRDEGHGMLGIVVDELVDQLRTDLASAGKIASASRPQLRRGSG